MKRARTAARVCGLLLAATLLGCPSGDGSDPAPAGGPKQPPASASSPEFVKQRERFQGLYRSGNLGAALDAATSALTAAPDFEQPYVWVSKLHTDLSRDADGVRYFARLIEEHPEISYPWFYKGFHEWHLSLLDDSLRSFERAAELDPSSAKSFYRQAVVLHRQGEFDRALDVLRESDRLEATAATSSLTADILRITGRHAEAKPLVVAALEEFPDSADLHYDLALLHLHDNDHTAAERELRRAIELNPASQKAHQSLARLLFQIGREEEARREQYTGDRLRDYEKGKRTLGTQLSTKHDPALQVLLAEVELTGGKLREAMLLFGRSEKEMGPSVRLLAGQAEALYRAGRLDAGDALLARLGEAESARIVLARATGLIARGEQEAAKTALDEALAGGPGEREFLRRVADLYARLGLSANADELNARAASAPALEVDDDLAPLP